MCAVPLHSPLSLLTSLLSHFSPFVSQQVLSPLFPSHPSPSWNLPRLHWRWTHRSSRGSCGLWVVSWVCDLSLYFYWSTMGLWFVMWVCVLWWLWMRGFVVGRLLQVVVVGILWWWAFFRWWWWWVVGMGLKICGFGGSALLQWQWSNSVLILVARCLMRWGFIWILWASPPASWLAKQRGDEPCTGRPDPSLLSPWA